MVLLRSHPLFRTDLKWIAWSVRSFNLTIVQELKQVRFYLKTKESVQYSTRWTTDDNMYSKSQ